MNVKQLKRILNRYPDDMRVFVGSPHTSLLDGDITQVECPSLGKNKEIMLVVDCTPKQIIDAAKYVKFSWELGSEPARR